MIHLWYLPELDKLIELELSKFTIIDDKSKNILLNILNIFGSTTIVYVGAL